MTAIHERLKQIIAYSGLSNRGFAVRSGINYNTFDSVMSGRRPVSIETAQRICLAYPEISERWFLLGEGEMLDRKIQELKNRGRLLNG